MLNFDVHEIEMYYAIAQSQHTFITIPRLEVCPCTIVINVLCYINCSFTEQYYPYLVLVQL